MFFILFFGVAAIFVMVLADDVLAGFQHREAEPATVVACGLAGMIFFVVMLFIVGEL